jgi:hypothetical protein
VDHKAAILTTPKYKANLKLKEQKCQSEEEAEEIREK